MNKEKVTFNTDYAALQARLSFFRKTQMGGNLQRVNDGTQMTHSKKMNRVAQTKVSEQIFFKNIIFLMNTYIHCFIFVTYVIYNFKKF